MNALPAPEQTADEAALLKAAAEANEEMTRQFFRNAIDYITDRVDLSALTKNTNYALQGDGIYAIIKNRIGKFIIKQADAELAGLPRQFNGNKLVLDVPKIPGEIYYQIRQFFTDISKDMGEAEAFCQVYYDLELKTYIVHVPEQEVSKASVKYDATANLSTVNPARFILVFEIHSHNTMNAFWSGTDDSDEKDTRFYGVLGELNKEEIGEKFRTIVLGKYIDMKKENIFDFSAKVDKSYVETLLASAQGQTIDPQVLIAALTAKPVVTYPKEWIEQIQKPTYHYNTTYNRGGYQGPQFFNKETGKWEPKHAPSVVDGEASRAWQEEGWGDEGWGKGDVTSRSRNWSGGNTTPDYPNKLSRKDKKNSEDRASGADSAGDDMDEKFTKGGEPYYIDGNAVYPDTGEIVDPDEALADALTEKEYEERFDLTTVEPEWEEYCIMQVANTLDTESVMVMLDQLIHYGFEEEIFEYFQMHTKQNKKGAGKGKNKRK